MRVDAREQVDQQRQLFFLGREIDQLAHAVGGDVVSLDGEVFRFVHVFVGELQHAMAERCREQHALAFLARRHAPEQEADVLDETQVEHAVGLVDDDDLDRVQREHVLLQVIDQATRGCDDDVAAGFERFALLVVIDAAVDQRRGQAGVAADGLEILVDLDRKFPGRRDDDGAWVGQLALGDGRFGQEPVEHGNQECGGLAGAGLRLAGDIAAGEGDRQRQRLDRGAASETGRVQSRQDIGMQAEALERDISNRIL